MRKPEFKGIVAKKIILPASVDLLSPIGGELSLFFIMVYSNIAEIDQWEEKCNDIVFFFVESAQISHDET